ECAAMVRDMLFARGVADVQLVAPAGGPPAVLATKTASSGMPTVLLYAHYDVVAADPEEWATDPFVPTVQGNRLFARGTADDKAGIAIHLAAVEVCATQSGVGIVVLVEGEEEVGSPNLAQALQRVTETAA